MRTPCAATCRRTAPRRANSSAPTAKHYLISRSYISDEQFTRYYESQQPGLAQWLADAIEAEAQLSGVDLANPTWD
ncbi:TipAS antibiotic-recognition domain-containing protein [Rothia nasimurium]|uniref:TipAS antibiotic-recognition domain-containing protein n=1 Tax=Rothia nasimurium TaxID=85336 RepID=UPI003A0FC4A6